MINDYYEINVKGYEMLSFKLIKNFDEAAKIIYSAGIRVKEMDIKTFSSWGLDFLTPSSLLEEYPLENFDYYVLLVDGKPAGAAIFSIIDKWNIWKDNQSVKSVYFSKISILKEFRGQNLASKMLDLLKEEAKKEDIKSLVWKLMEIYLN